MEVKHGLMWLLTLLDFKKHLVLSHWLEYFWRGIAYAVFEGHATNDYTPYTYKTTDFGKHGNQLLLLILMVLFVTFKKILPMKTYYTRYRKRFIHYYRWWSKLVSFTNKMPSVAVHYMELSTKTIRWLWQLMVAGSSR
jgi:hypothetical protein